MDRVQKKKKMEDFEEVILGDVIKTISLFQKDRFTVNDIISVIENSNYYVGLMKLIKRESLSSNINAKLKPWRDIGMIIELPKDSNMTSNNEKVYKVSKSYLDLIAKRKIVDKMKVGHENTDLAEGKAGKYSDVEKSLDTFNDNKMHFDDLTEEMLEDKAEFLQHVMKDNAEKIKALIKEHSNVSEDIKTIYDLPDSKKVIKDTHNKVITKVKKLLKFSIKEQQLISLKIKDKVEVVNSNLDLTDIQKYEWLKEIKYAKESLGYLSE